MTRRVKGKVDSDDTLRHLVEADTGTVCIVGKCWDYHVLEALDTTLDEGVAMVADSVAYLKDLGRMVLFDAEHFFDGFRSNPEFSLRVLEGAVQAGVDRLVLCDTNGGSLPADVEETVRGVVAYLGADVAIGVHLHDDTGCGVANALAGVRGGATQVQGTINGYGERTGNCNLTTIIPNLTLKMGIETLPPGRLERLTPVAHHVAELVNMSLNPQAAYVGCLGVRPQGGAPRERDRQATRRVRAHPARHRRQRHPLRAVGARGSLDDPAQGGRARARARRSDGEPGGRHAQAPRARGLPLRGRRRVARAAHAARHRLGADVVPGRVVPGHHRRRQPHHDGR